MPVSRWSAELIELLDWVNREDLSLDDIFLGSVVPNIIDIKVEQGDELNQENLIGRIPSVLPILPLRGLVVYPETAVPLSIGQPRSIRLVDDVLSADDRLIGLLTSKDPQDELPGPDGLYQVGTVASVHRLFRAPDGTIRLLVQGITRFEVKKFTQEEPYLKAEIKLSPVKVERDLEIDALTRQARDQFSQITNLVPSVPRELVDAVMTLDDPLQVVYTVANFQKLELAEAQELLELNSVSEKLHKLVNFLTREMEMLEIGQRIQNQARSEIEKVQRDYFLREQMKAIRTELGEDEDQAAEIDEFRRQIDEAGMPEEADKQARRELDRMSHLPSAAAEFGVIRTYLDWMVSLPWSEMTEDNLDITRARKVLDEDHYGLEDVKERILEFLAVRKLRKEREGEYEEIYDDDIRKIREGVILCFVGPPGVGKTSLGRSIARSMDRQFIRISLGGVRDEAEIRGHRRTYIGAMPGRILQALRRVGKNNPVFMLDEIDKLGRDYRGDPTSALLEVLDPEQNSEFRDHYLEVAYDLSKVMFITTANLLEPIPSPLRDRMEIIKLSGYTDKEKKAIAKGYLIPRQIRENGLRSKEISFTDPALQVIIRSYTRESGVRNLERELGSLCRKVVTMIAEGKKDAVKIGVKEVAEYLGRPRYYGDEELANRTSVPGVATGLAWTSTGGEVLFVEATSMPGKNSFQLTGSLGEVMKESAQAALSYVRSKAGNLGLDLDFYKDHDIHLHVPAGAQPKDGPSAGVTMATALVSLISQRPVKGQVTMTGEITLRGQVLPVGGIKEKVLAAYRAGSTMVILPKKNQADLEEDIPKEVLEKINFVFVENIEEVLDAALTKKKPAPKKKQTTS
ncbi:MAG: endopeptidase La [Anaerolineales bacterium]|nr:endopeptidase La [Anaerolineales bacterium]